MICAALRDVERKKDTTGVIAFEENVIIAITKTVKEHGESLKVRIFLSSFTYNPLLYRT